MLESSPAADSPNRIRDSQSLDSINQDAFDRELGGLVLDIQSSSRDNNAQSSSSWAQDEELDDFDVDLQREEEQSLMGASAKGLRHGLFNVLTILRDRVSTPKKVVLALCLFLCVLYPSLVFGSLWAGVITLVKLVLWLVASLLIGLWLVQGHLLYLPNMEGRKSAKRKTCYNPGGYRSPADFNLPFEEHYIEGVDGTHFHVWLVKQPQTSQAPTLLYFHGNAGNIGYRLGNVREVYHMTGCNILMVEYRGYGNSDGIPSESTLKSDGVMCVRWLADRPDIDPSKIICFGRSLGGAVAIATAHACPNDVAALIVENTFTSIADMVETIAGKLGVQIGSKGKTFLDWFMTSHWKSIDIVPELRMPILFLSGGKDELIPPSQMAALHKASTASSARLMHVVPEGTHNNTFEVGGEAYYDAIGRFISAHV